MRQKNKYALALAGGGMAGFIYEIACLKALEDFLNPDFKATDFDIFVGTSAGASISAILANGTSIQELYEATYRYDDPELKITRRDVYRFDFQEQLKSLLKTLGGSFLLLRKLIFHPRAFRLADIPYVLGESLPSGLFSLNCFEQFLAKLLTSRGMSNDFCQVKKELLITANNLDTAHREVFGRGYREVPISQAIVASSAIPLFFKPYTIGEDDFVDGGLGKVAHIDLAIQNGANVIIVVNPVTPIVNDRKELCIPSFKGHCAKIKTKGLGAIWDQAYRMEVSTKLHLGIKRFQAEHPHIKVLLIEPDRKELLMFSAVSMNLRNRVRILKHGYEATLEMLEKNKEFFQENFGPTGRSS